MYAGWAHAAVRATVDVHRSHHLPRDIPLPPQEAARDAERASRLRFEPDDICAAACADGLQALLEEATLLDAEIGNLACPDTDASDFLDVTF